VSEQAPDALEPVYNWLVDDMAYPFNWSSDKPPWLDVSRLAAKWAERDGETAEDYRLTILDETGWDADDPPAPTPDTEEQQR
jgi:hypothetical protein